MTKPFDPPPDDPTRRQLLRWMAGAPAVALLGCRSERRTTTPVARLTVAAPPPRRRRQAPPPEPRTCEPTHDDAEGPYWKDGSPSRRALAAATEPGQRLVISGRVVGPDCRPLAGAHLDVWQADRRGRYFMQRGVYRLRGRLRTDHRGEYRIDSILPGRYLDGGGYRPRHLHFKVSQPGHAPLTTQMYFAGDPYLHPRDSCPKEYCDSSDAARIVKLRTERVGTGQVLAGAWEIVLAHR